MQVSRYTQNFKSQFYHSYVLFNRNYYPLRKCSGNYSKFHNSSLLHTQKKGKSELMDKNDPNSLENIRNIGIIAHIDAGKTTTTERMLYYVGFTNHIGEVHDGSTVTDYLKPERERGITITSACIPMLWKNSRVNLIDTPGHADFTMEVERSMRVLDGAVCVLDAVAGVEAQTETVWSQANRYSISRLAYINKLDREGASCRKSFSELKSRLKGWGKPVLISWPVVIDNTRHVLGKGSGGPMFQGIIDLITMEYVDFSKDNSGSIITRIPLSKAIADENSPLYRLISKDKASTDHLLSEATEIRDLMIEQLAELDDEFLEQLVNVDLDASKIDSSTIDEVIKNLTINGKIVPTLCGSSYKNIGVQNILDAIVKYIPSPKNVVSIPKGIKVATSHLSPSSASDISTDLVGEEEEVRILPVLKAPLRAIAFKIIKDKNRGILVFVRIYSGTLRRGDVLYNVNKNSEERAMKVLEMYADDYEELPSASCGNVVAISGLKVTATGDTLMNMKDTNLKSKDTNVIKLDSIRIPSPVFMRAVVPKSQSDLVKIKESLDLLTREDPSIRVHEDNETGQVVVSGMGELHLEITQDRLKETYGIDCNFGKVQISYKECLSNCPPTIRETRIEKIKEPWLYNFDMNKEVLGVVFKVSLQIELFSFGALSEDGEFITISPDDFKSVIDESLAIADWYDNNKHVEEMGGKVKNTKVPFKFQRMKHNKVPAYIFKTRNQNNALINYTPTEKERQEFSKAVFDSMNLALTRGPLAGFPLSNVGARITKIIMAEEGSEDINGLSGKTTPSAVRAAVPLAIKEAISKLGGGTRLLEPYMSTEIVVRERHVNIISRDITRSRLGNVLSVRGGNLTEETDNENTDDSEIISDRRIIQATIPLSSMIGYSTTLRTLTQGEGTFTMELHGYKTVPINLTDKILQELREL